MIIDQLFTRPLFEESPMASPEQLAYNKLRAQYDGYQAMTSGGGNTAVSRDPAHAAKLATVPAELARMAAALKAKGIDAEAQYDALSGPKAAPVDANQAYGDLSENKSDPITQFASNAHEEWRRNFDPTGTKPRIKKNSDGTEGDINVPFEKLHPDWKKENLAAAHAAHHAVKHFGRGMEKAAEHVHNEWMKRNPKGDWNAAQHVPYEQLPDDEKEKDRVHVRTMMKLLGHNPEQNIDEASAANDYFTRRKSEEDRIAGVKAPAKNKKNPANTDYAKKRKQQDVEESFGRRPDHGREERHDLDPTDWYIVKDGKMFAASIYPRQVQQAIAQGFSRTKQEARAKASSEGVAEGSNDTIYPNAEVIKSKNGKPVGEIYQDGNSWGCFHYKADRGYDFIDSREDAIEALKDLHQETGRSRPDYTIKGVAEAFPNPGSGSTGSSKEDKRIAAALRKKHIPTTPNDKKEKGVAEGSESPEKEIERLKLRQDAEHGHAPLRRQAATQARIRELEKQIKGKQGVAEATGDERFDSMMGQITGGAGARQGVDSLNRSLAARTGSNPETALAKWGQEFIQWLEKICRNISRQDVDKVSRFEKLGTFDDGGETMAHWLIEVAKKSNTSGITLADMQEFSSEFNAHGMWAWHQFPVAWAQNEWQDYKDQWTGPDGYIANLGQGVAEGFNEYAGSDDEEARMYDAGEFGDDYRDETDEARMSAAQRLSTAWDRQRAKSDASLRRTPSSIPKTVDKERMIRDIATSDASPEHKKVAIDAVMKTMSESRVKRQQLLAQMLNSH